VRVLEGILRYLHFLGALTGALLTAWVAALPLTFMMGLPSIDAVGSGEVIQTGSICTGAAILAFWLVGCGWPLGASIERTALAGAVAGLAFVILIHVAARSERLTADSVIFWALLALATLGFLPFQFQRRVGAPLPQ
jgi:hypothetical protein